MQYYRHIQLNCHQDKNILETGEKWTWLEKIQGAAGGETLRGARGGWFPAHGKAQSGERRGEKENK